MPKRILVVDDNEMNLTLVAKILELEGYQVIMAHNGKEALKRAAAETPDLAVLDIMMTYARNCGNPP